MVNNQKIFKRLNLYLNSEDVQRILKITNSFQDKSESSENESNKKDENESPGSSTGWTGFNGSGSVAMTGHLAGLLAQNGQNGGSSSVNFSLLLHKLLNCKTKFLSAGCSLW